MNDGYSSANLFNSMTGYSYQDLIVLPGYVSGPVDEINLSTQLTRNISIQTPAC